MNKILRNRWLKVALLLLLPITVNSYDHNGGKSEDENYTSRKIENGLMASKVHDYVYFVQKIGMHESSNRYDVTSGNTIKYFGKYQFSYRALLDIGMESTWDVFLQNNEIQERAMFLYLKKNTEYLSDLITVYEGRKINNVLITKAGILAGAHLVGNGGVRKYLTSNGTVIPQDGNGTTVQKYIALFQTTNLTLDEYVFNLSTHIILNQHGEISIPSNISR